MSNNLTIILKALEQEQIWRESYFNTVRIEK